MRGTDERICRCRFCREAADALAADEAAIRADERAKVEAEVVAWLRDGSRHGVHTWREADEIAHAVERGEHRKHRK